MRLQTFSPKSAGYLKHVSLSLVPWRLARPPVRYFKVFSKTGHGTVLIDRAKKPQTDTARSVALDTSRTEVNCRPVHVKRKWHINNARSMVDNHRLATSKPCTVSAARSGSCDGEQPRANLVPSLVPNRAFPFIKHAGDQAALGLHKPIGLVLASAYLLGAACQLSGTLPRILKYLTG